MNNIKQLIDKYITKKDKVQGLQDPELPFDWDKVIRVSGDHDIGDWELKYELSGVHISSGDTVSWTYKTGYPTGEKRKINLWVNACIFFIVKVGDKWYLCIGEWLQPQQTTQSKKCFRSIRDGKKMFHSPLDHFIPEVGKDIYFGICDLNWCGLNNGTNRSQVYKVKYR